MVAAAAAMSAAVGVGQQWVLVEMVQAFYEVRGGGGAAGAAPAACAIRGGLC